MKWLKIQIPARYSYLWNIDIIRNILGLMYPWQHFAEKDILSSIEEIPWSGRYFLVHYNSEKTYIVFSWDKVNWRNTYLAQYVSTVFNKYLYDTSTHKRIYAYLLDTSEKANTPYHSFIYRCVETLWIKILNIDTLDINISKFTNYQDFKNSRLIMQKRNNNSTFFDESRDGINFFGKVFGANGKEATLLCLTLSLITKLPITFFQVLDNEESKLSSNDKNLLEDDDIRIDEKVIKEYTHSHEIPRTGKKDPRDTPTFHYNLFKKYWEKKCYLCDCDVQRSVIGAHIHRVSDIKNDLSLTPDEKWERVVNADNWFWLCANHDKWFEYWLIYFMGDKLLSNKQDLNIYEIEYIERMTLNTQIDENHYWSLMEENLWKHRQRNNVGEWEL